MPVPLPQSPIALTGQVQTVYLQLDAGVYDRLLLSNLSFYVLDVYCGQQSVRLQPNTVDLLRINEARLDIQPTSLIASANPQLQIQAVRVEEELTESYPLSLNVGTQTPTFAQVIVTGTTDLQGTTTVEGAWEVSSGRPIYDITHSSFAGGADSTGGADSAPAYRACNTKAEGTGGIVFSPIGTYLLNTSTTVAGPARTYIVNHQANNVMHCGAGREATLFRVGSGIVVDGTRVFSTDSNATVQNLTFQDFTLDGNSANLSGSVNQMVGISLVNAMRCRHFRVRVRNIKGLNNSNFEGTCYDSHNSFASFYLFCEATTTAGPTSVGFSSTASTGDRYESCDAWSMVNSAGFAANNDAHLNYSNCHGYLNGTYGFSLEITVDANYVNCTGGGKTQAASQSGTFAANTTLGNTLYGWNLNNVQDGSWVNCDIRNNVVHGWSVSVTGCARLKITGGAITDNGQAGLNFAFAADAKATRCKNVSFNNNAGGDLVIAGIAFTSFGTIAAPAIPASGVALVNPYPFDATVYVAGGNVTIISIDAGGFATGLVAGSFEVAGGGGSITTTYTVAPGMVWVVHP